MLCNGTRGGGLTKGGTVQFTVQYSGDKWRRDGAGVVSGQRCRGKRELNCEFEGCTVQYCIIGVQFRLVPLSSLFT